MTVMLASPEGVLSSPFAGDDSHLALSQHLTFRRLCTYNERLIASFVTVTYTYASIHTLTHTQAGVASGPVRHRQ